MARACPDPGEVVQRLSPHPPTARGFSTTTMRRRTDAELSPRERELLPLLAGSLSQRDIGGVLHLSVNTIKTHSRVLFRKLGVSSRAEAVARARELGLL